MVATTSAKIHAPLNSGKAPLEVISDDSAEDVENRLDKLEGMIKSQDATLQKLTSIMAKLAEGSASGSNGDDS